MIHQIQQRPQSFEFPTHVVDPLIPQRHLQFLAGAPGPFLQQSVDRRFNRFAGRDAHHHDAD
jgi:hypothetical protein